MSSKIVLFSDLHYGINLENRRGKVGVNTFGKIRDEIILLRDKIVEINPSFSVNFGDVVTGNSKGSDILNYGDFLSIFKDVDLRHLIGNNDFYFLSYEELFELNLSCKRYFFEKDGFLHIFINCFKKDGKYYFDDDLFDWLSDLIFREGISSIIYSHFPISGDIENLSYYHVGRSEACFVSDNSEFRDFMVGSNVKCFISGHTHFYFEKVIDNIKYITVPSFSEEKNGVPSCEFGVLSLPSLDFSVEKL